jgi:hypothetical protein
MLDWEKLVESKGMAKKLVWLCVAIMLQLKHAYAIDLQPNDVRAPPPGISSVQVTYQHSERGDYYVHGDKAITDRQIASDLYLWRAGYSFEIAEHPAYFYAQVPTGAIHPQKSLASSGGDSGVGDTTLLLAFWPYSNRETQTYFAVGAYLSLPTGSYDKNRYFNVGENVYKTALQVAYQQPITDKLNVMGALDVVWTGNNTEYRLPGSASIGRLEQSAQYNAQAVLNYALTPTYDLAVGYYYSLGAEATINGLNQDNEKDLHRYQLFATAKYPIGKFTAQYGSDIKTENGYFEDHRFMLRYMKAF